MSISKKGPGRRRVLKTAALAAALPLVHIRGAGAAGKLTMGFWDHWVPKANDSLRAQVVAWGEKNKVEVEMDFVTSVGGKLMLTGAAQAQAKKGHDLMTFRDWEVQNHAEVLEPVDDLVKQIIAQAGAVNDVSTYLAQYKGSWRAVPTTVGSNYKGPVARISMLKKHANLDVTAMYPAEPRQTKEADAWTWEAHLKDAEACHKAGVPFGIGQQREQNHGQREIPLAGERPPFSPFRSPPAVPKKCRNRSRSSFTVHLLFQTSPRP